MKKTVRIGLVGSGFMGRTHALGFRSVGGVFDLPLEPVLELLADATDELAATAAARYGFARSVGDWHALVEDAQPAARAEFAGGARAGQGGLLRKAAGAERR
jgi:predicted dehydrogenase